MKRQALKGSRPGPYFAYDFAAIGETGASIYRTTVGKKPRSLTNDGDFVMQVASPAGADELVAILNAATALAARADLGGNASYRIAAAVAVALGGKVDAASFTSMAVAA